jgi:hypothetical protein
MRTVYGQLPFESEVAFRSTVRVSRDDRDEQGAVVDLLPYLPVPHIPTAQLALIEPDLNAGGPERLADAPSELRILGGVAKEYGL